MSAIRFVTAYVPTALQQLLPAGAVAGGGGGAAALGPGVAGGAAPDAPERVLWCSLQWVDGWVPCAAAAAAAACGQRPARRLIAAVAGSGGFQLWDATSVAHSPEGGGGAPRELASVRGPPLKFAHVLAAPADMSPDGADAFEATRPLVALAPAVDSAEFPVTAVKIFSMATCK